MKQPAYKLSASFAISWYWLISFYIRHPTLNNPVRTKSLSLANYLPYLFDFLEAEYSFPPSLALTTRALGLFSRTLRAVASEILASLAIPLTVLYLYFELFRASLITLLSSAFFGSSVFFDSVGLVLHIAWSCLSRNSSRSLTGSRSWSTLSANSLNSIDLSPQVILRFDLLISPLSCSLVKHIKTTTKTKKGRANPTFLEIFDPKGKVILLVDHVPYSVLWKIPKTLLIRIYMIDKGIKRRNLRRVKRPSALVISFR